MDSWREDIFNNFIKLNRGFDLPNARIKDGIYPVIASTSIKAYHNQYKVKSPCVVTGRSGSLGTVQFVGKDGWPLNTTLYVKDFKGNYPKFAYYFLQQMHLENFNSGAGVPTLNQNHLHKLKIQTPELPTQRKIAAILTAYDDLIENNNKQITILENMAENIYKEWFVRMRFPGYKKTKFFKGIPQGWEIKKLKDFCFKVTDGTHDTPKPVDSGYPLVTGKHLKNGKIDFGSTYLISKNDYLKISQRSGLSEGDVLFSNIGTIGSLAIVNSFTDYSVKNLIIFKQHSINDTYFLYFLLMQKYIQDEMQIISSGASQQFIGLEAARKYKILVPVSNLINEFGKYVSPLINMKVILENKIESLNKTRNLLLPRLLNGKLKVESLDINFPPSMENEDA